jgi:hypothetical protein
MFPASSSRSSRPIRELATDDPVNNNNKNVMPPSRESRLLQRHKPLIFAQHVLYI